MQSFDAKPISPAPAAAANPRKLGVGTGAGHRKNRDTFPLASPCAARALDRPREIGGGGGVWNVNKLGARPGCIGASPRNRVSQQQE